MAIPPPSPVTPPPPGVAAPEAGATEAEEAPADEPPARPDATSPNNPYRPIVARNAFRLREPAPPPPPPTNAPAAPEPVKIDVKLAGLAKIKGVRYAYLMVPDADRPGQFLYPSLTDDPTQGKVRHGSGLEVREIDMKKGTVRVVNGGIEATLNFKENGIKSVPGAPAAGKPGSIPAPGTPPVPGAAPVLNRPNTGNTIFPAGSAPQADAKPANAANEPMVFSRNPNRASTGNNATLNNPSSGTAFAPVVGNNNAGVGSVASGTPNIPTRTVRTDSSIPNVPSIPVEQQFDLLIRQRQAAESIGVRLPPIPGMPDTSPTP